MLLWCRRRLGTGRRHVPSAVGAGRRDRPPPPIPTRGSTRRAPSWRAASPPQGREPGPVGENVLVGCAVAMREHHRQPPSRQGRRGRRPRGAPPPSRIQRQAPCHTRMHRARAAAQRASREPARAPRRTRAPGERGACARTPGSAFRTGRGWADGRCRTRGSPGRPISCRLRGLCCRAVSDAGDARMHAPSTS